MTYALIQLETYGDIPGFLWRTLTDPAYWAVILVIGVIGGVCKSIADSQDDARKKRRLMASAKKGRGEGDRGTDGMTKAGAGSTGRSRRGARSSARGKSKHGETIEGRGRFTQREFV